MGNEDPTETDPYVVGTAEAGRLGGHGKTKTHELINSGEYESYLDGRIRLITTRSIRARIRRKLEESRGTTKANFLRTNRFLFCQKPGRRNTN